MLRFFTGLALFLTFAPLSVSAEVRNLSSREANSLLQGTPDLFILDVRTPGEYQRSRLEGARLIPIDQLSRRLAEIPGDRPILVYCAVGSRSSQVASYLDRQGIKEVYNLFGGIWGWQLSGYAVLTGGP